MAIRSPRWLGVMLLGTACGLGSAVGQERVLPNFAPPPEPTPIMTTPLMEPMPKPMPTAPATPGHSLSTENPLAGIKDLTPETIPGRSASCAIPEHENEHEHKEEHHGGLFTSAEYLLIRARRPDLRFALVDPTDNLAPNGNTQSLSLGTRSGFRIGVGYRLESGWSIGTTYQFYQTADNNSAAAPPGGTLYPLSTRPGLIDNVRNINADASLDTHVFDAVVSRTFKLQESLSVKMFGGLQFATIGMEQRSFLFGGDAVNAFTTSRQDFDGAGPLVGGEGHWVVGSGFSMFSRGKLSLLYGDQQTRLTELNDAGLTINTQFQDRFSQVVPIMNLGLGVAWRGNGITASAGYEVTNWLGLVQSPRIGDDFAEGKVQYRQGDLGLEGFFMQVGLEY